MTYFISFIYGASLFYVHRFFPIASVFISLILIALLFCSKVRKQKGCHCEKQSDEAIPFLSRLLRLRLAMTRKTLFHVFIIAIIAASGFYYAKASSAPEPSLSDIGGDSYFLNPGGNTKLLTGYAMEIKETGGRSAGFFQRARSKINKNIRDNFSEDSAAFLMSIITGERSLSAKETRDAFNATGLAHILSISGAHFGLLLFILFRMFRFLIKRLPHDLFVRLSLYLTPSQIAAILCVPFMIGYLGISGMSVPAIRAFIMINLFLFGLMIQRKGFWLNTLLFAAVIVILIQPDSIVDLSFQLSFIAVFCIGIAAEHKNGETETRGNGELEKQDEKKNLFHRLPISPLLRFIMSSGKISLAATIGTAPLVAYHFHYFSVISPVTNLIFTPVIGFVILPAALVLSFVSLIFNIFPLHSLIDAITSLVIALIKMTARLSFVDIKIPAFPPILLITFYLGVMVYVIARLRATKRQMLRCYSAAAIALMPVIIYIGIKAAAPDGIKITYLDVGQGDSAVVELPDNKTIAIDTGRRGFQTAGFLRYKGIKTIDAVILSHGQSDHAGGMRYLLKNFKVHEIWDNGRLVYLEDFLADMHENITHRKLQRGDIIEGKGYRITVLHPYDGFYTLYSDDNDENNDSIVLKIQGRKNSFLFTGDIEEEAEDDIAHLKEHLKSSVLKIPHHGSKTSASQTFLSAVSPEVAVISVGRKNTYGHPHDETLDALDGVKIFRTDMDGAIGIRETDDGSLDVRTWREFQLSEAKNTKDELLNFKKLFLIW